MNRPILTVLLTLVSLALAACASTDERESERERARAATRLATLEMWMTGTFSNDEQAETDPEGYAHIRLVMQPIWPERTDGHWLYVEQAAMSSLDRPYRQRVYHLATTPGGVISEIYKLPDPPSRFLGGWDPTSPLHALSPADLTLRTGCTIHLEDEGSRFAGGTLGTGCSSSLGDASFATSDVSIRVDRIVSWDQGFTADSDLAWGPEAGGYEFVKRSADPPSD